MTVSLEQLKQLTADYYESLTDYENACEERYLEELHRTGTKELAAAKTRVGTQTLKEDLKLKLIALEQGFLDIRFNNIESNIVSQFTQTVLDYDAALQEVVDELYDLKEGNGVGKDAPINHDSETE